VKKVALAEKYFEDREIKGQFSTDRVKRRYEELIAKEPYIDGERAQIFTEYIKKNWTEPLYVRMGGALKEVLSKLTPKIWEDELIVGNISRYFRGTQVYPEYETWMLEGFKKIRREEERYIKLEIGK
jgi:hypothetical protein